MKEHRHALWEASPCPVIVDCFSYCVPKYITRRILRRVYVGSHFEGAQPITAEKARQQELEAGGHTTSVVRKQSADRRERLDHITSRSTFHLLQQGFPLKLSQLSERIPWLRPSV